MLFTCFSYLMQVCRLYDHFLWIFSGDYELTMDGIHENILKLQYHDPLMQKTVIHHSLFLVNTAFIFSFIYNFSIFCFKVKCLNSVGISDMLLQYSGRTQHMSLYGMLVFISAHMALLKIISVTNDDLLLQFINLQWPFLFIH